MRQVTFESLRTAIQVRYDLPAFTTATKPTLEQINVLINASASRLSGLLCEAYGDDYFTTASMIQTAQDNSLTSLPTSFFKLKSLIWLRGPDDPVEIIRASVEDYARRSLLSSRAWTGEAPSYRLNRNSQVWWLPRPNAIYDVTCTYVQTPFDLVDETDTVEAGPGWEEWVVNDVCVRIAQIYEQDPSVYMSERSECEQHIRSQAPDRDETQAMSIRDVRSRDNMSDYERRDWFTRYG